MTRLSIDLTPDQHQKIKAVAALNGSTIREYVLERILPHSYDEELALQELESFLEPRIKEAMSGNLASGSARTIFKETLSQ